MEEMPILHIEGPKGHCQEFTLGSSDYTLGRDDGKPRPNHLAVRKDPLLSRSHLTLKWQSGRLSVGRAAGAKNPIFFCGREEDEFFLEPGQTFLSGGTRFTLKLAKARRQRSGTPTTEFTLARTEIPHLHRPNINECFRALVELLPELRTCTDRDAAFRKSLEVLKELVPEASEVAVLRLQDGVEVLCQELSGGRHRATPPSRRLLERAFDLSSTVTHVWAKADSCAEQPQLTVHAQADWAIASPIEVANRERYALHMVGSSEHALTSAQAQAQKEHLDRLASLIDLVAETLGHHLAVARFNLLEGQVVRFFSPVLRQSLSGLEFSKVLEPKRRRVTVLFFDLRGFSRATERAQDDLDSILHYHGVLTDVMTTVTNCVFAEGGIVVDYQGDAVMACWGALADDCQADSAVRAAIAIVKEIFRMQLPFGEGARAGMRCGIGIATGEVIAGQVGAQEQTKFGVLGPTVNLASRLEGLTKYFRVPILLNAETQKELSESTVCRRIGLVRPAGLNEPCEVHELVLDKSLGGSGLSQEEIHSFETASSLYQSGEMEKAYDTLMAGSRAHDPIARFLARHILDHLDYGVPRGFDGVLGFRGK